MEPTGIVFAATVEKVQTLKTGGWRVTFDVPPQDAHELLKLTEIMDRTVFQIAAVPQEGFTVPS